MDVIKSKIKLINQKDGAVEVFLSGMSGEFGQSVENVLRMYMDPESSFSIVREQYVAVVNPPKSSKGEKNG